MRTICRAAAIALTLGLAIAPAARAEGSAFCAAPPGWTAIIPPLERFAARVNQGGPLTIVTVGSSSTAGSGASSPQMAYPNRLEAELRQRFPELEIHVINRGKGGEDAPEELARLGRDVVDLKPDLAIWQVGTNAVLRRDDLAADGELMREGVDLLKRNGIDVVLMDLQYAPRVLERSAYPVMEEMVAETADNARVGLFRRFALMRYWQRTHDADAPAMIGADGLHMTDAGYGCLATDLAAALEANWRAGSKLAQRAHGSAAAIADLPVPTIASPSTNPPRVPPPAVVRRNDAVPFN